MSDATIAYTQEPAAAKATISRAVAIGAWIILIALALAFIAAYAAHYFVQFNEPTFGPYWPRRGALLLHVGAGIIALLTAPFQFLSGYRRMPMRAHRWIGRVFVGSVAAGSVGALYLSVTTTFGWAFGFATMMMNVAWISTTAMAYYAIRRRLIAAHKEWMIRAYAITFAFVIIRLFNDVLPTSQLAGREFAITLPWASWAFPFLAIELILQLKHIHNTKKSLPASLM
jgi:uncharacterized membrane protein YozB (DUF420 family)